MVSVRSCGGIGGIDVVLQRQFGHGSVNPGVVMEVADVVQEFTGFRHYCIRVTLDLLVEGFVKSCQVMQAIRLAYRLRSEPVF